MKSTDFDLEHTVTVDKLRPKVEWAWNVGAKEWEPKGNSAAYAEEEEEDAMQE